jgi:hypothetical protein
MVVLALQDAAFARGDEILCSRNLAKQHVRLHAAKPAEVVGTQKQDVLDNLLASAYLQTSEIEHNYRAWVKSIHENSEMQPYDKQWEVLNTVHEACLADARCEAKGECFPEALLRLIHGLPGSGKSKLLKWLRTYFEDVLKWTAEVHFVFLAPLNSMAANIDGATVHSWGNVAFVDRRGVEIKSRASEPESMAVRAAKNSKLRFVVIDECEAAGIKLLGELVESIKEGKRNPFGYGGVHFLFSGDFWQLPPVGEKAIMHNPMLAMNTATPTLILDTFWLPPDTPGNYPLQEWPQLQTEKPYPRVLHLSVNMRSGKDKWFSAVLDACRLGALDMEDYCFLHGQPTRHCGSWVSLPEAPYSLCGNDSCKKFFEATGITNGIKVENWKQHWQEILQIECAICARERKRRKRVLQCEQFGGLL